MALRNIKITRDIVQTCNKLRAFNKSELCTLSPHKPAELSENTSKFHYTVTNSLKNGYKEPTILPEVNVTEKNSKLSPLMELMTENQFSSLSTRKGTAFDPKNVENIIDRNTADALPLSTTTRFYSSKKSPGESGCKPMEKKCIKNLKCPRFKMRDCPPTKSPKGSDCSREYHDPNCTKKMAPYPSYSELCAYRLEDDPSECLQCPWQKCGGVDDIKPQKKNYHTSTRSMNMAMIPGNDNNTTPFFLHKQCDASKEPCKEPPPKCKKREVKKDKCPEKEKPKKKCSGESWIISGSMRNLDMQRDLPILGAKEHDEGHPPPCDDKHKPKSEQCPGGVDKKRVYRKERDLHDPAYRKYPIPYSEQDHK